MNEEKVRMQMVSALDALREDLGSIRTGRASPALVENIVINAYGGAQKLRVMELANITASDPQTLVIDPWDKSIIGEIRQGILASNIGFNPSIDGEVIRISMPPLTSEDREKFVKLLNVKLENAKVQIRQIRGDQMREIKKAFEDDTISEDEKFGSEKDLQKITDEFVASIESLGEVKEKELRGN